MMKPFCKPGVLALCSLGTALLMSGCSRNVATAPTAGAESTPITTSDKPATTATSIQWETDLDTALSRARETQKPIMIDFYATWCPPCKLLDEQIYPAADVVQEAQHFISVKIDVDKEPALRDKYNASGLPTIVFLDASGKEIHRQIGIDGQVGSFVQLMQTARARVAPTAA